MTLEDELESLAKEIPEEEWAAQGNAENDKIKMIAITALKQIMNNQGSCAMDYSIFAEKTAREAMWEIQKLGLR